MYNYNHYDKYITMRLLPGKFSSISNVRTIPNRLVK